MVNKIKIWLSELPLHSIERLPCGSIALDPDIIQKLENIVDRFQEQQTEVKNVIMQVKPHLLYNVSSHKHTGNRFFMYIKYLMWLFPTYWFSDGRISLYKYLALLFCFTLLPSSLILVCVFSALL